jgi:hypothetical protein
VLRSSQLPGERSLIARLNQEQAGEAKDAAQDRMERGERMPESGEGVMRLSGSV